MPSAANAALCIAGERLWATGQPATAVRIRALTPLLALGGGIPALLGARGVVLRHVALELSIARRERVRSVPARLHDVEEVVHVRRMRRRLERSQARIANRPRRQALTGARVVARVDLQLGDAQRTRPV